MPNNLDPTWNPIANRPNTQALTQGMPMSQFDQNTGAINGLSQTNHGVALQTVTPDDLLSEQLSRMMAGNSPFVRHAADNAGAYAGARGAGADSSIYQAGAVNALYDQLTPIAEANARRYADVSGANQDAINQENIDRARNATSMYVSAQAAANQRAAIDEQRRQFNVEQGNRAQNREWQLADQRSAARATQRSQTFNTLLSTIFSDPSYWRDPEGAMGMFNTYMSNIDSYLSDLFPEYNQQPGDATAGGST